MPNTLESPHAQTRQSRRRPLAPGHQFDYGGTIARTIAGLMLRLARWQQERGQTGPQNSAVPEGA